MWTDTVESAPGTVTQVRASAQALIRFAKKSGAAIILVGHVTKDGQIAGPRVVEHMVDAVLSFEGEGSQQFRILRAVKNRFGPTDEIGVFEMTGLGLREVSNPSELFLSERDLGRPGTAVFAGIEGTRPVLVELQALVAPTSLGTPRRAVVGWDPSRLSMVLAVLEAHCGVKLSGHDVYLNVAGGLRIQEPAADLAAAAALVSSLVNAPLPTDAVYFGEISLSGAVRPVAQTSARLKEAAKLGFGRAVLPESARGEVGGDAGLVAQYRRRTDQPGRGDRRARHAREATGGTARPRQWRKMPHRRDSGVRKASAGVTLPVLAAIQPARKARDGAISGLAGRAICPSLRTAPTRRFAVLNLTSGPDQPMPITILDLVLLARDADFRPARDGARLHARDPVDRGLGRGGAGHALRLRQAAADRQDLFQQRHRRGRGRGRRRVRRHPDRGLHHHGADFRHDPGFPDRRAGPHPRASCSGWRADC